MRKNFSLFAVVTVVTIAVLTIPLVAQQTNFPELGVIDVESIKIFIQDFREADPFRENFDLSGRVRDVGYTDYSSEAPGVGTLLRIQNMAWKTEGLKSLFENSPTLIRRQILKSLAPVVAEYVGEYVHRDHVQSWLLDLDWDNDIATLDPRQYRATKWPDDRTKPIQLEGREMPISKIDFWWRAFWKRRGQGIFEAMKMAFEDVYDVTTATGS